MMTGCIFAEDQAALDRKIEARGRPLAALRERGMIVATPKEVAAQLEELSAAGVQRVMLQWLDLDDLHGLEALAGAVP
jgi:alkanesulfonate monooxygenase SsuD/methylene tetrahydromethanopterin reductase-like flavin-dependent oxidoreductase (luciferase family)